jgi:hypothetical protein
VHERAPLRLAQLWHTLGWTPGVGFGGLHEPMRPPSPAFRELRAAAAAKRTVIITRNDKERYKVQLADRDRARGES